MFGKDKVVSRNESFINNYRLDFIKTERGASVRLKNGKYECSNIENYYNISVESCVRDDKQAYYGGIITVNSGGTGSFFYLVLFHKEISIAHKFLGDRVKIKDIYFLAGKLETKYFIHTTEQAMSDIPKQLTTATINIKTN